MYSALGPITDPGQLFPACQPVRPPPGPPILCIIVDAEEEFPWAQPISRDNSATASIRQQKRAQAIFAHYDACPTYLVTHPITADPAAVGVLREYLADGHCEIGAQLHPWVTPPFDGCVGEHSSFPGNLPAASEREKLLRLTDAVGGAFGVQPVVYKAGRYGFGPHTAALLEQSGYLVDTSLMPRTRYSALGGPDFSALDYRPFWFGSAGRWLLELPVTRALSGRLSRRYPQVYKLADCRFEPWLRVAGLLARTRLIERITISPEGSDLPAMRRLTRTLLDRGERVFTLSYHSPSLEPGNTPYVRTARDLAVFLDRLSGYLCFFRDELGGQVLTPRVLREQLCAGRFARPDGMREAPLPCRPAAPPARSTPAAPVPSRAMPGHAPSTQAKPVQAMPAHAASGRLPPVQSRFAGSAAVAAVRDAITADRAIAGLEEDAQAAVTRLAFAATTPDQAPGAAMPLRQAEPGAALPVRTAAVRAATPGRGRTSPPIAGDKRCLVVANTFPPVHGGSAIVYDSLARFGGGRVSVLAPQQDYRDGTPIRGWREFDRRAPFRVHRIRRLRTVLLPDDAGVLRRTGSLGGDLLVRLRILLAIRAIARAERIGLLCVGELVATGWLTRACRLLGLKTIVYVHGEEITTRTRYDRNGLRRRRALAAADGVVAVSRFTRDALTAAFGVAPSKIRLVANGVDLARFKPRPRSEELIARYGLRGRPVLLTVSRLHARKGIDRVIESLPVVLRAIPDLIYLVVGEGAYRTALDTVVARHALAGHVVFAGAVADGALADHYSLADVFVMANREMPDGETEGFGLVFLEANACGLPVIAGRAGGSVDAVADGVNGLLVDGNDAGAIAGTIVRLFHDPKLRARLGADGAALAAASGWENAVGRFLGFCDALTGSGN